MLDINITTVYQIIGYMVFFVIIHSLLRNPIVKILDERDKRINGARAEAKKIEADVDSGIKEYEDRLKDATLKGMDERGKLRKEAQLEEQAVIEAARDEANTYLGKIKGEIAKSKEDAVAELKVESKVFSKNIVEKVLSRKVLSMLAFLLPILMILPAVAFASSGGGGEEHASSGMMWKVINFVILCTGLYFAWTKVIKGLLEGKSNDIKVALEEAAKAKEKADATKREYGEKLKLVDKKIDEIQADLKRDGEVEKERILKEAAEAAARIKEQTKILVDQEVEKAKAEIRREVALLSIDMAENIIKKEFTDDDQARLVKDSLEKVRLN